MSNFDGKYSERKLWKNERCRNCKKTGYVYYLGTSVDHGNPFTPAADTEVTHYFYCDNCKKEFETYA